MLLAENVALRNEMAGLRQQLAEMTQQWQAALAWVAELEQGKPEPPAFVKPNRPSTEPKGPRKKRVLEAQHVSETGDADAD